MNASVLWGDGLLLAPQHFQQQQRLWETQLNAILHRGVDQPWGVCGLQWDHALLQDGILQLIHADIVFQDGCHVQMPMHSPLPGVRYLNQLNSELKSCQVYLCLPEWKSSENTTLALHQPVGEHLRYRLVSREVNDLLTGALPVDVLFLLPNASLKFEHEPRDGTLSIPLAQLEKNTQGHWVLDERYIPPLVQIQASDRLMILLRSVRESLLAKSQSLVLSHRQRNEASFEYSSKDIAAFWLHHAVNTQYPLIDSLLSTPGASVLQMYRQLSVLAASLMVFSPNHTLSDLPVFNPLQLRLTFETLLQLIRTLLDTVVSTRFIRIPLHELKPTLLGAQLGADWDIDKLDFYLAIRSDVPTDEWLSTVPVRVKIGNPDDVDRIIHTALPGIKLSCSPVVPPSLPVRIGQVYFALDKQDELYERMMQQRSMSMYIPESMRNFEFEMIAVYR